MLNQIALAQSLPVAPATVEIVVPMATLTQEATARVLLPGPCEILGVVATVTRTGFAGGALVVPTSADFAVNIELPSGKGNTRKIGQLRGDVDALKATTGFTDGFVSLDSLDARNRLISEHVDEEQAAVAVTVRWKRRIASDNNARHEACLVCLSFLVGTR